MYNFSYHYIFAHDSYNNVDEIKLTIQKLDFLITGRKQYLEIQNHLGLWMLLDVPC